MRNSRPSQTESESASRRESLGDWNSKVLMAGSFWDASVSDTRGAGAECRGSELVF